MESTMQLNPYLVLNGQCEAAFKFYEKALGGKIEAMMRFGESPAREHTPAKWHDKIMHASMKVGDSVLMASDSTPDRPEEMKGMSVALHPKEPAEAERIFHALAEKGNVIMPIQETFWAKRFGMLVDQFGTPWMVNCSKEG
jgi:PhnB protein